MTYFAGLNNKDAVLEWEIFAEQIKNGELEWYEYWQVLDMRESFDNGERQLTEEQKAKVEKADAIIKEKLIEVIIKYDRLTEYQLLGENRPKKFWWWHL